MSERSDSQKLGSQGQSLVAHLINSSGDWIALAQDEDYGIDMEAELSSPFVSRQLLKIQVKTSTSIKTTDKGILCQVPRKLAAYADSCRLPVILVRVDIEKQQAWYEISVDDWHQKLVDRLNDQTTPLPKVC